MNIDFEKQNGLIPVVIQDYKSLQVLMLGYMNKEALEKTLELGLVTFYSRSKQRLWTKGETSGNTLELIEIYEDCDSDTILIKAKAHGPTCHTGSVSCFKTEEKESFLYELEETISNRIDNKTDGSYTYSLYQKGVKKVAQKVGEEAVETVIEAMDNNHELFINEAADLMYHLIVLLKAKGSSLKEIEEVLKGRN